MLTTAHELNEKDQPFSKDETQQSKRHLKRVSATLVPPTMAAFHGCCKRPFQLYTAVSFDMLHVIDLGTERMLPDLAFCRFSLPTYNKRVMSKEELVHVLNQRFSDINSSFGIRVRPFRTHAGEVHASMTGIIRRTITQFLWTALICLELMRKPDEDSLLRAALIFNMFQIKWYGVIETW